MTVPGHFMSQRIYRISTWEFGDNWHSHGKKLSCWRQQGADQIRPQAKVLRIRLYDGNYANTRTRVTKGRLRICTPTWKKRWMDPNTCPCGWTGRTGAGPPGPFLENCQGPVGPAPVRSVLFWKFWEIFFSKFNVRRYNMLVFTPIWIIIVCWYRISSKFNNTKISPTERHQNAGLKSDPKMPDWATLNALILIFFRKLGLIFA